LLAANLLIHDRQTLIDKFFCMNGKLGREYHLYFLSWFTNIRYCLERGFTRYQSGQAYYENKLRLGSRLTRNTIYFKHRNVLAQGLLRFAARGSAQMSIEKVCVKKMAFYSLWIGLPVLAALFQASTKMLAAECAIRLSAGVGSCKPRIRLGR